MFDLGVVDKFKNKNRIFSLLLIVVLFVIFHGSLTLERQLRTYTLYGSSRHGDAFQDMYYASFELDRADYSKKICERMKENLLKASSDSMNYECRRGPYAPYKFMIRRYDLKSFFWQLMPQ